MESLNYYQCKKGIIQVYGGIHMKPKKVVLILVLTLVMLMLSGCVNVTCNIKFLDNDKADIKAKVFYTDSNFKYNNQSIENVKDEFTSLGYLVKDIDENGMRGFSLELNDVNLKEILTSYYIKEYGINIKLTELENYQFSKGFFANKYVLNPKIDITDVSKIKSVTDGEGKVVGGEELSQLIKDSHLRFSVTSKNGSITKTDEAAIISKDDKIAEWVLLPDKITDVSVELLTSNVLNIIGTIIILSVILVFTIIFMTMLIKMYIKRKKECSE